MDRTFRLSDEQAVQALHLFIASELLAKLEEEKGKKIAEVTFEITFPDNHDVSPLEADLQKMLYATDFFLVATKWFNRHLKEGSPSAASNNHLNLLAKNLQVEFDCQQIKGGTVRTTFRMLSPEGHTQFCEWIMDFSTMIENHFLPKIQ